MFQMLTEQEIKRIHEASCTVLEQTGVTVLNEKARRIFHALGAKVDETDYRVRIPVALVEQALQQACGQFTLWDRDGASCIDLMDGNTRGHNVGGCIRIYDHAAGCSRDATREDLRRLTILIDALDEIEVVRPVVYPTEFPVQERDIYTAAVMMENTTKPYGVSSYSMQTQQKILKMAAAVAGGMENLIAKPFLWGSVTPISPLKYSESTTGILMGWAEAGLPLAICPCPIAGGGSPVTLSGTLVQSNAEFLVGYVLVQAIRPGIPVKYTTRPIPMDLRNGLSNFGAVELGMMSSAIVQLSKYYHVCSDVYGLSTSALVPDERAGYEKAMNGLLPMLSGADLIASAGMLENALSASVEQLVIDNDIIKSMKRVQRGILMDEDALGVQAIDEAVEEGNFLASDHTLTYMREEVLFPPLASYALKQAENNPQSIVDAAAAYAQQLLASSKPPILDDKRREAMYEKLNGG